MRDLAIRTLYPNVVTIYDETQALDADGNEVVYDEAAVAAKAAELRTQLDWDDFRKVRNSLLKSTDWWASSDLTMTAEQISYRQALRDLPANTTDPTDPVWPTKPS